MSKKEFEALLDDAVDLIKDLTDLIVAQGNADSLEVYASRVTSVNTRHAERKAKEVYTTKPLPYAPFNEEILPVHMARGPWSTPDSRKQYMAQRKRLAASKLPPPE